VRLGLIPATAAVELGRLQRCNQDAATALFDVGARLLPRSRAASMTALPRSRITAQGAPKTLDHGMA
jgi:hypothetical protein